VVTFRIVSKAVQAKYKNLTGPQVENIQCWGKYILRVEKHTFGRQIY